MTTSDKDALPTIPNQQGHTVYIVVMTTYIRSSKYQIQGYRDRTSDRKLGFA